MGWKFKNATVTLDANDWFTIDQALSDVRHETAAAGDPAEVERLDDLLNRLRPQVADHVKRSKE